MQASGQSVGSPAGPLSPRAVLAFALALAALAYIAVWRFEFVYDDHPQIQTNLNIRTWASVRGYFTSQLWANTGSDRPSTYYRPMFLLWLRLGYLLFGLEPAYWHLASLILHLIAICLVYVAAKKLLQIAGSAGDSERTIAAIAALVFALHPGHVEAVAWISAVSELLLTIFFLAAFICYANARIGLRRGRWTAWSLVFLGLALLTKETAITFVFVVLACEAVLALREGTDPAAAARRLLNLAGPWMIAVFVYLAIRWVALGELGHAQAPLSWPTVVKSVPALLWFYTRHLLWPHPLSEFYDVYPAYGVRTAEFLVPACGVLAVALVVWVVARRSAAATIAALWILLTLVPVLDVALLRTDALVADRYLYLPSFGFCVLAGMFFNSLARASAQAPKLAPVALAGLTIGMGVATARQLAPWENDLLLFERAVAVSPGNAYAKSSLAAELMLRNENDRALSLLLESYARDPNAWMTSFNLGYLYYRRADLPQAERYFRRAIQIDPHNRNQYLLLGVTLKRESKLADAEDMLRRTVVIWPQAPYVHTTLGEVLEQQGRYDDALVEFAHDLTSENPAPARAGIARIASERESARAPGEAGLNR